MQILTRIRRAEHVAGLGENINAYRVFFWKPEGNTPLGIL
jgi:hypothetical protein